MIASSSRAGVLNDSIIKAISPGTYFFRVALTKLSAAFGEYTLAVVADDVVPSTGSGGSTGGGTTGGGTTGGGTTGGGTTGGGTTGGGTTSGPPVTLSGTERLSSKYVGKIRAATTAGSGVLTSSKRQTVLRFEGGANRAINFTSSVSANSSVLVEIFDAKGLKLASWFNAGSFRADPSSSVDYTKVFVRFTLISGSSSVVSATTKFA